MDLRRPDSEALLLLQVDVAQRLELTTIGGVDAARPQAAGPPGSVPSGATEAHFFT